MRNEIKKYICSNCGEMTDYPKSKVVGCSGCSIAVCLIIIGIILLLFGAWPISIILFIVALLVPIMYHNNKSINICRCCEANNALIPTYTPKGEEILNKYHKDISYNTQNNEEQTQTQESTQEIKQQTAKVPFWGFNKWDIITIIALLVAFIIIFLFIWFAPYFKGL